MSEEFKMGEKEYIIKGINKFVNKLQKDFVIEKVIFFGSRNTDNFREDSDINLIIVSPDFNRQDFFERVAKMYDYWVLDYPVDFLCYTPKEFDKLKKRISIVKEALNVEVEIKCQE